MKEEKKSPTKLSSAEKFVNEAMVDPPKNVQIKFNKTVLIHRSKK